MTHKQDLLPYIHRTQRPFATVQDTRTDREDRKMFFCCFGCKKHLMDRDDMAKHMKDSADCRMKHYGFLDSIGYQQEQRDRMTELREENQKLRDRVKELEQDQEPLLKSPRQERLEKGLIFAENFIHREQEYLSYLPMIMKPEIVQYCAVWIQGSKRLTDIPLPNPVRQEQRKKYLEILETTPELQIYLMPSYTFLSNQNYFNGEYQAIRNKYFERLDYRPGNGINGEFGKLRPLPIMSEKDLMKLADMFM